MKLINITINKADVYDEVGKQSAYVGANMDRKIAPFEQIAITDGDRNLLERYYQEAAAQVTALVKPLLSQVGKLPRSHGAVLSRNYNLTLSVSDRYDDNLTDSATASLFSFFVNAILGKWFMLTNKEESAGYIAGAQANLEDLRNKIYYKQAPVRP